MRARREGASSLPTHAYACGKARTLLTEQSAVLGVQHVVAHVRSSFFLTFGSLVGRDTGI